MSFDKRLPCIASVEYEVAFTNLDWTVNFLVVDRNRTIVHATGQADRLFRYPMGGFLGLRIDSLMPEPNRKMHAEVLRTYFNKPMSRPMGGGLEISALGADSREFPVQVALGPTRDKACDSDLDRRRGRFAVPNTGRPASRYRRSIAGVIGSI